MKVSLSGGAPEILARLPGLLTGASWSRDGTIVFGSNTTAGLWRIAASGGQPVQLTKLDPQDNTHESPQHLPDGKHLLFAINEGGAEAYRIAVLALESGEVFDLGIRGRGPRYIQRGNQGYLMYEQASGLVAVPFNRETLNAEGVPVTVLTPINVAFGVPFAVIADNGTLVYAAPMAQGRAQLVWVGRDGSIDPILEKTGVLQYVRLSPDGRQFAAGGISNNSQIFVQAWDAEPFQLSLEGQNTYPVWSPDESQIAFASNRLGSFQLFMQNADGTGESIRLLEAAVTDVPLSWSPDGERLFFYRVDPRSRRDIYSYSFKDGTVTPLVATQADERTPVVSPDGRWLAYLTDSSGVYELWVKSLDNLQVARQITRDGAAEPAWSRTGEELFYRSAEGQFMAVTFKGGDSIQIGRPERLFEDLFVSDPFMNTSYSVAEDGRFLMIQSLETPSIDSLQVILGFAEEVHRRVSAAQ